MDLMYLLGEPGVGKSTLMAALTDGQNRIGESVVQMAKPFVFRMYSNGVMELGGRRDEFSGTDMLPLHASPLVLQFLDDYRPAYVMGEGARLGTSAFLGRCRDIGYAVHVYHLTSTGAARRRREAREHQQRKSFVKGRITSSAKVAAEFGALDIETVMPPDFLVKMLTDPVSMKFRLPGV